MNTLVGARYSEKVRQYWILSRIWHKQEVPSMMQGNNCINTMGEMIDHLSGLADFKLTPKLDSVVCSLLDEVIQNKRCRKRKPTDNVISLRQVSVVHEDGSEEKILLRA